MELKRVVVTGLGALTPIGNSVPEFWESLINGVSPTDPRILSGVVVLVLTVAMIASYLPARRASLSDPIIMLRAE